MRYQIKWNFKCRLIKLKFKLNFKRKSLKLKKIRQKRTCDKAHGMLLIENVTF